MPASPIVRELRWTDFPDLTAGYFEAYEERARGEPIGIVLFEEKPSMSAEADWFAGMFRRVEEGAEIARVGDVDGHAVGLCTIHRAGTAPRSETSHVGDLGLFVHRAHRGRGLGRALMTSALEEARHRFSVVRLSVFSTNDRAKRLYESLGFVTVGRIPRAVRRGTEFIDTDFMVLQF